MVDKNQYLGRTCCLKFGPCVLKLVTVGSFKTGSRFQLKCDGTRWRTGGEVEGKLANVVGSQYSSHTSAASSRLNWRPCRFKWTLSVSLKDEIGFLRVRHHISNAVYLCTDVRSVQFTDHSGVSYAQTLYGTYNEPWVGFVYNCEYVIMCACIVPWWWQNLWPW